MMKTLTQTLCALLMVSCAAHAGMGNRANVSITIVNKSSSTLMPDLGLSDCSGIIDEPMHNVKPGEVVTGRAHANPTYRGTFEWVFHYVAEGNKEPALVIYASDNFINVAPDEKRFVVSQRETYTHDTTFVRFEIRDTPAR